MMRIKISRSIWWTLGVLAAVGALMAVLLATRWKLPMLFEKERGFDVYAAAGARYEPQRGLNLLYIIGHIYRVESEADAVDRLAKEYVLFAVSDPGMKETLKNRIETRINVKDWVATGWMARFVIVRSKDGVRSFESNRVGVVVLP
jgi:hypothetical protein